MKYPLAKTNKLLYIIGHVFFLSFIGLAIWFFRERALFGDACFQVWIIVKTKSFAVFHNRLAPALVQLLPVGAVKAGLPLNAVLQLYSVSVPVIIYICYLLIAYPFRKPALGLGLALAASIMLTDGFYYATGEINQGVAAMVLLTAVVTAYPQMRWWQWLLAVALITFGLFLHPLILIGCLYVTGYLLITHIRDRQKRVAGAVLLVLTLAIHTMRSTLLDTSYEAGKMSLGPLLKKLPQLFEMPIAAKLGEWMLKDYYLLLIGSAILLVWYVWHKKWLALFWYFSFAIGYAVVAILALEWGADHIRYYLEHHYQLFALFLAVPLGLEVLPPLLQKYPRAVLAILAVVLLSRLLVINASHRKFTNQHKFFDKIYAYTEGYEQQKYMVDRDNLAMMLLENSMYWPVGYASSLYYTSKHSNPPKALIIPDNYNQFDHLLQEENILFGLPFNSYYHELDPRYVALPPGRYLKLNTPQEGLPSDTLMAGAGLKPEKTRMTRKRLTERVKIPVTITSTNGTIRSGLHGPNKTMLGFKVYHKDGHRYIWKNPEASPLEVDVKGTYTQYMDIPVAEEAGEYIVEIDFWTSPDTWWNRGTEIEMTVTR